MPYNIVYPLGTDEYSKEVNVPTDLRAFGRYVDEFRKYVRDIRLNGGQPPIDSDNRALEHMLGFIAYGVRYYEELDEDEVHRVFYNTLFTAGMLAKPLKDDLTCHERLRTQYTQNGNCLFRDMEFLSHTSIPDTVPSHVFNFPIEPHMRRWIIRYEFPKIAAMMATELDPDLTPAEKKQYRHSYTNSCDLLPVMTSYVWYWRDKTALDKMVGQGSVIRAANPNTLKGKLALLRALVVLGEQLTEKQISPILRHSLAQILNLETVIGLRNKLAHPELFLAHGTVLNDYIDDANTFVGVKEELARIVSAVEEVQVVHQQLRDIEGDVQGRRVAKAIRSYYHPPRGEFGKISQGLLGEINAFCIWLEQTDYINVTQMSQLKKCAADFVFSYERNNSEDLLINFRDIIGETQFSPDFIAGLKSPEYQQLEALIHRFNAIDGRINARNNISTKDMHKALGILNKLLKNKAISDEIYEDLNTRFQSGDRTVFDILGNHLPFESVAYALTKLHSKASDSLVLNKKLANRPQKALQRFYEFLCKHHLIVPVLSSDMDPLINAFKENGADKVAIQKQINRLYIEAILHPEATWRSQIMDPNRFAEYMKLEKTYRDLLVSCKPAITDPDREELRNWCLSLLEGGLIDEATATASINLINTATLSEPLCDLLRERIGDVIFDADILESKKSDTHKDWEVIYQTIGGISVNLHQEYRQLARGMRVARGEVPPDVVEEATCVMVLPSKPTYPYLDRLYTLLPDDSAYLEQKQAGITYAPAEIVDRVLVEMELLQALIAELACYESVFAGRTQGFQDRIICAKVSTLHDYGLHQNWQYNLAVALITLYGHNEDQAIAARILQPTLRDAFVQSKAAYKNSDGLMITLPIDSPFLSTDQELSGEVVHCTGNTEWLDNYIAANRDMIKAELIEYAQFLLLSQSLKFHPVLRGAIEQVINSIYPLLKHLPQEMRTAYATDLEELEFRMQRNIGVHGDMYVDLSTVSDEEFLLRYASMFLLDMKPTLEEYQAAQTTGYWQQVTQSSPGSALTSPRL